MLYLLSRKIDENVKKFKKIILEKVTFLELLYSFFIVLELAWNCMQACSVTTVMSYSSRPYGLQSFRLLCPCDSLGKNTGMGCHAFLQRIFPTQGSTLHLPHCRQTFYPRATWEASGILTYAKQDITYLALHIF